MYFTGYGCFDFQGEIFAAKMYYPELHGKKVGGQPNDKAKNSPHSCTLLY